MKLLLKPFAALVLALGVVYLAHKGGELLVEDEPFLAPLLPLAAALATARLLLRMGGAP